MAKRVQRISAANPGNGDPELESRIRRVYREAAKEMQSTVTGYFSTVETRVKEEYKLVEQGRMTEEGFRNWCLSVVGRGQRYEAMRDALAERYVRADEVAMAYINDDMAKVYAMNRNYEVKDLQGKVPYLKNVNFIQYNENTVKRLLVENPNLMPNYPEEKAVARGIDLAYGKEQITASVTSGILQGKSIGKIANDLQNRIETMSRTSAIRTARTAVTAAENAGKMDSAKSLESMGVKCKKVWRAHIDERTRIEHAEADGQEVDLDEPFIVGGEPLPEPGDDSLGASGWNIYNCRCHMEIWPVEFESTLPEELQGSITIEEW